MITALRDASQQCLETHVLSCTPDGARFRICVADSVLYPEGGGQPPDHGWLDDTPVVDVQRIDGAIHCWTETPVQLGTVTMRVDWARRYDHMQQHTGQHLLSALAADRFGWETTAFHLGTELSDVELAVADPSPSDLEALEAVIQEAIRQAHPIAPRVVRPEQLAELGVRSRRLPEGLDTVRLVEISGIDCNTCGGTHLSNTAELQIVRLVRTERIRGGTRVFFQFGGRVLAWIAATTVREAALTRIVSAPPAEHTTVVETALESAKQSRKAHQRALDEIADLLGAQLASQGPIAHLRRATGDVAFLNRIASAALAASPSLALILVTDDGAFLAAGPPEALKTAKASILQALEGRGGGRPGRLQGRAARTDNLDAAVQALQSCL